MWRNPFQSKEERDKNIWLNIEKIRSNITNGLEDPLVGGLGIALFMTILQTDYEGDMVVYEDGTLGPWTALVGMN